MQKVKIVPFKLDNSFYCIYPLANGKTTVEKKATLEEAEEFKRTFETGYNQIRLPYAD